MNNWNPPNGEVPISAIYTNVTFLIVLFSFPMIITPICCPFSNLYYYNSYFTIWRYIIFNYFWIS